jgi:hypothetical protein
VPAQHRIRAHDQPQPSQHVRRQPVQERREEGPVTRGEPHLLFAQLAFQHRDLMAQGEDLHILVPVIHREQPEHGEHVRGGQAPKTK